MKRLTVMILIIGCLVLSTACGNENNEEASTNAEVSQIVIQSDEVNTEQELPKETKEETENEEEVKTEKTDETETDEISELPEYEYPGPELFYSVLYDYMAEEFGKGMEGEVGIPCPVIIEEDFNNKEDNLIYGDFWYFTYNKNGDTLECVAGGQFPGVIHVKSTETGYEVTGFDRVEDGSNFTESAKEIFGKYYDEFSDAYSDTEGREKLRAQIIANYVFDKELSITSYKDYGCDPVSLPEQNIDNFYSNL